MIQYWLWYSWVNHLSNNCVTIGLRIATLLPLHCWSSSGNGVDWLCVSISNTVVGNDWWISIHWYYVQDCDVLHLPTGQFWQNYGELPSFNMFGDLKFMLTCSREISHLVGNKSELRYIRINHDSWIIIPQFTWNFLKQHQSVIRSQLTEKKFLLQENF